MRGPAGAQPWPLSLHINQRHGLLSEPVADGAVLLPHPTLLPGTSGPPLPPRCQGIRLDASALPLQQLDAVA
jgi:hypothetical protein